MATDTFGGYETRVTASTLNLTGDIIYGYEASPDNCGNLDYCYCWCRKFSFGTTTAMVMVYDSNGDLVDYTNEVTISALIPKTYYTFTFQNNAFINSSETYHISIWAADTIVIDGDSSGSTSPTQSTDGDLDVGGSYNSYPDPITWDATQSYAPSMWCEYTIDDCPSGTNMQINISDSWKEISGMQINISDSWRPITSAYVNIGDSWKTIF